MKKTVVYLNGQLKLVTWKEYFNLYRDTKSRYLLFQDFEKYAKEDWSESDLMQAYLNQIAQKLIDKLF